MSKLQKGTLELQNEALLDLAKVGSKLAYKVGELESDLDALVCDYEDDLELAENVRRLRHLASSFLTMRANYINELKRRKEEPQVS